MPISSSPSLGSVRYHKGLPGGGGVVTIEHNQDNTYVSSEAYFGKEMSNT